MQNSLAVIGDSEWQVMQQQADALVKSGFLPQSIKTAQQAVAIMMLGRELGIPPWAALSTINVIQGKPTVSPQLMLALINRSGQLEDMQVADDGSECVVTMRRRGRSAHSFTFSMADAQTMQLAGKDNWKKQPAIMRQWRAVAGCARVVFADVILGLYTPEEMGADVALDGEGNMSLVEVTPVPKDAHQTGAKDDFAKQFPAASKWTPTMLGESMQDYFNGDAHFKNHWDKHEAEYDGLTLEEAQALVRKLHWNWDKNVMQTLLDWALETLRMSAANVAAAMGVKKWRDFDGSYAEAQDACTVWAEAQAAADLQREAVGK